MEKEIYLKIIINDKNFICDLVEIKNTITIALQDKYPNNEIHYSGHVIIINARN